MPPQDSQPLSGKRILIVEDEFLILLDIQSTLEAAGANVVTASRVQDGVQAVVDSEKTARPFDAAILDLKLDHENSAPIAERLASAGVPFVFLTGAPTDVELARQFGSAPVVGKPFDAATLLSGLQRALARR